MNLYKVFVSFLCFITGICVGFTFVTGVMNPPISKPEAIFIVVVLFLNVIYVNITPAKQIVLEEEVIIKFLKEYFDNKNSVISDG